MTVIVPLEIKELHLQISGRPEQRPVETFAANRADQAFDEWMRQRRVRHRLDGFHVEDSQIDDLGIEVHFVKEGVILSDDSRSSEKFMHGIKVLMAKNYIDNLGEEVHKGMLEKARQGHRPSFAPIGYVNSPVTRRIEPDASISGPIITKLFEWYATGECSLKAVTAKAAVAGLTNRSSGSPLARSKIHQLLQNPIYSGDFHWLGQSYEGQHQPLISRDLFQRVQ